MWWNKEKVLFLSFWFVNELLWCFHFTFLIHFRTEITVQYIACLNSHMRTLNRFNAFLKNNYRDDKNAKTTNVSTKKDLFLLHQRKVPYWASLTFDPSRVTLVGLLPLLTVRARERGATAAFVGRNTLSSIQAGLSAHSYSQDKNKVNSNWSVSRCQK